MVTLPALIRTTTAAVLAVAASSASVRADDGAILVTGTTNDKQRITARSAVTSALRSAQWTLVDANFDKKEVAEIQGCLSKPQVWTCIAPIASAKAADRLLVLHLTADKLSGGIVLHAQVAGAGTVAAGKDGYCAAPCSESTLAQSSSDLVGALLADVSALTGNTFIEVITDPVGATVNIDARDLGPSGKKYPSRAGRHHVLLQLAGYHDLDLQVDVVGGETKRVERKLVPLGGAVEPPHRNLPPPPTRSYRGVQWSMIGGGAVVLGGGLLASYLIGRGSVPDASSDEALHESYRSTPALVVAGVGGAVAVTGLVWLLVSRTSNDTKAPGPAISVSPAGAQAAWTFTF